MQTSIIEPAANEKVNRVTFGRRLFNGRKCPMRLVLGTLGDPATKPFLLHARQTVSGFGWRHLSERIIRINATQQITRFRLTRNDRNLARVGRPDGDLALPRRHEVMAALNRLRGARFVADPGQEG